MTPKVENSYLNAKREQIIDAACLSFIERGFDRTTLKDICKAAGLSAGAIYNYFSGKEAIIEAVSARSLERNLQMISSAVAGGGNNPIVNMIRAFFPLVKEEMNLKIIGFDLELYAESTRNPRLASILQASHSLLVEHLTGVVKQMQIEGKYNGNLDPKALAEFFMSLFHGLVVLKVSDPEIDIDAATRICEIVANCRFDEK